MSDRSNFRVVRDKEKENISFKRKIVEHRLSTALRIIGSIAALVLVVVILVMHYNTQVYTKINVLNHIERTGSSENRFLDNKGSVIIYSEDGVSCINEKGASLWNMTYEMQNPIVEKNGGYVAVADNNGHVIHMVDSSGKVYEIDTKLPIRAISVSGEGLVAAVVEDQNNSWVYLYDAGGTKLVEVKATMTKTGYPLSVALSGEVMAVSYLYVDSDTMRSSVTFYNFGGIGENYTDRIVSSYEYTDCIIPFVSFLDSETICAIGDDRLNFYTGSKKPTSTSDSLVSEQIVGVYYGDTDVALVFFDNTGEHKYRVDLYEKSGRKAMSYAFDIDFKDILVSNSQVMIYNEAKCIIVSSEGKEKYNGDFEQEVQYVASTDSPKKYLLVSQNSLDMVRFE